MTNVEKIARAMNSNAETVIQFQYLDSAGKDTTRIASPIRFAGQNVFLALCLCRAEPRKFKIDRCRSIELKPAHDYVMPVEMENTDED